MIRIILAAALLCALTTNADARQRHRATGMHKDCNVLFPCIAPYNSTPEQARVTRGRYVASQMGFGAAREKRAVRARKARQTHSMAAPAPRTAGLVAPLASKVAEIQAACGSKVISAIRRTYIAGTRHLSLHASGQAVDMAGNPACIYSRLQGYSGGYSVDYGRMRHVHISWGGPEQGLRFAHGGGKRHARRYARHRHNRYAAAR